MLQIKSEAVTPFNEKMFEFDSPFFTKKTSQELPTNFYRDMMTVSEEISLIKTFEETVNVLKRKFDQLEESMERIRTKFRKIEEMRLEIRPNHSVGINGENDMYNSKVKLEDDSQEIVYEVKSDDSVVMDLWSFKGMILNNSDQFLVFVKQEKWMFEVLCKFCDLLKNHQIAIFCRSKLGAMHLAQNMNNKGYEIKALCADLSKKKRNRIVNEVLKGNIKMLTLTASLDVEGLKDVIQNSVIIIYNMPQTWESIAKLFGIEQSKWKGIAMYTVLEKDTHYQKRFKHFEEDQINGIIKKINTSTEKYCLFHI